MPPAPIAIGTIMLGLALALHAPVADAQSFAIRGATIETAGPDGAIEDASLVVRDGKVEAVGPRHEIDIPIDLRVVDGRGMFILPGMIDPYTIVSLPGTEDEPETRTITVNGRTFTVPNRNRQVDTSFKKVSALYEPYDTDFRDLLRSGLTRLNLVSGAYGQAAVIRPDPDPLAATITQPDGRIYLSLENVSRTLKVLRDGLESGRPPEEEDDDEDDDDDRRPDRPRRPTSGRGSSGSGSDSPEKAAWKAIVAGEAPLIVNAGDPAAVAYLLDELEEDAYREVEVHLITNGETVYQTFDRLAARDGLALILTPSIDERPYSRDRINIPRRLEEAGVPFLFRHTASNALRRAIQDMPLYPLAMLVKTGLPREAAIEAVSIRPARQLGIAEEVGSIEPGKAADLLLFDGDPLTVSSRLITTIIQGRTVHGDDLQYSAR